MPENALASGTMKMENDGPKSASSGKCDDCCKAAYVSEIAVNPGNYQPDDCWNDFSAGHLLLWNFGVGECGRGGRKPGMDACLNRRYV